MNSEQLTKMFEAFVNRENNQFYKLAYEIIEDENKKSHHLLAKQLKEILTKNSVVANINGSKQIPPIPRDNEKGFRLLDTKKFFLDWEDVILSKRTEEDTRKIVEEANKEDLLATYGLKPKKKILFYGPPGTGKTLTAKVISSVLGLPLVYIRFESVISSFLGETASNLRKIFDFIEKDKWVVLFDEFDIIGKQRDDPSEHGEIKRVVNNFMMMLENYEGESILIASTNHSHLLDLGVWRRFDEIIYFGLPAVSDKKRIFEKYLRVFKKAKYVNLSNIVKNTKYFSGADIEQVCIEGLKSAILDGRDSITYNDLEKAKLKQIARMKAKKTISHE